MLCQKTIKTPTIKKIKGNNQSANVLNLKGGFKRIKSPYLSVKNLYISSSLTPSIILFLIKIRKSLASGAFDSSIDWGVYGIPETFVINSNGIIKYRHVGPITKKVYKKINFLINDIE